ncbi:sodium:proton antiporter [Heliobacterium undosum]|uniref:Sodium:proton antiporter n=1 Tax=Heliomicrobium undosum TaxID=121734 RepID=A0A845LCH4_9FIRM|nr:sodium:proton antiporter [Heliomicrobium undosum]
MAFLLFAVAILSTAFAYKTKKPYPIALVLVGLGIGLADFGFFPELKHFFTEDQVFVTIVVSIFLPVLIGEAAFKLNFRELQEHKRPILALAGVGTLVTYGVVGLLGYYGLGLPLELALLFGALMSATDPVSVLSIFKSLGVDKRLSVIMEGESLFNDGVAIVLFNLTLGLSAMAGAGVLGVAGMFVKVIAGGIAVGALVGLVLSTLTRFYDDYPLENAFVLTAFYGAYFGAEAFHVSGVIAVVVAGLIVGNYGAQVGMSQKTKDSVAVFLDTVTLIANAMVFILVGLEVTREILVLPWIVGAVLVVLIARAVAVYLVGGVAQVPARWLHLLNWGGLKGSLSIALALTLPVGYAGRQEVLVMTFGVVLFSLVVQGLTVGGLVRKLGVTMEKGEESESA